MRSLEEAVYSKPCIHRIRHHAAPRGEHEMTEFQAREAKRSTIAGPKNALALSRSQPLFCELQRDAVQE
jgi:hypothetical protein